MKKTNIKWITICVVLLALIVHVTKAALESQSPQPESVGKVPASQEVGPLAHGPVTDGLAAFLLCHSDRFKIGQPIPFSYGIVNIGAEVETYDSIPPIRVWWFTTGPVDREDVTLSCSNIQIILKDAFSLYLHCEQPLAVGRQS